MMSIKYVYQVTAINDMDKARKREFPINLCFFTVWLTIGLEYIVNINE